MTVGYDRSFVAPCDCLIATLACGFADGWARANSNVGKVGLRGRRYQLAGKVCMDMLMVNLGPPGGPGSDVECGDYAVLFGEGGVPLKEYAAGLGTAQSDVTCELTRRVARRYVHLPEGWVAPGPPP